MNPRETDRRPSSDVRSGCAWVFLFFAIPSLLFGYNIGRPWMSPRHGPLVKEALALPVPDSVGDRNSFFIDPVVAKYIRVGTEADRAADVLEAQGFDVSRDSVTRGGFVDQGCPECTSEIEGYFEQGRFAGTQAVRVWLGIDRGLVRYVKGRRNDRPPLIML